MPQDASSVVHPRWRFAVVLLVIGASAAAGMPVLASGATAPVSGSVDAVSQGPAVQFAVANNTTQHENPDEVQEDGDLLDVSRWLQGSMATRLEEGAIQLSQREYSLARRVIGDEYSDRLGQFVDVAGETNTETDDQTTDVFQNAREEQRTLTETVQTYEETYRDYRDARDSGDTERARRLARDLEALSDRVNGTATDLVRAYATISNQTGANMADGVRSIRSVRANITTQQQEIRRELFVATRLEVSVADPTISFRDPLRVRGSLTAANGTALANSQITLVIADRTVTTRTDATGGFTAQLRPATMPVGQQTITVRYQPRNESIYLGSGQTVTVTVSQITGDLRISERPETVAFGEPVAVTGSVTAAGIAAPDVPVVVSLGDNRLGTVRTDTDGTFTLRAPLPAEIPNGTHPLRASVPLTDRALAVADVTANVTVVSTATRLSLTADNGTRRIPISGTLTTADGRPIPEQPITLRSSDGQATTVQTAADGTFQTTVAFANTTGTVTITATFRGTGTNLGPSEAVASATIIADDSSGSSGSSDAPDGSDSLTESVVSALRSLSSGSPLSWLVAGTLSLFALGGAALVWVIVRTRRRETATGDTGATETTEEATATAADTDTEMASDEETDDDATSLAAMTATEYFDAGNYDAAVQVAYAGARQAIADQFQMDETATHWEFLADFETQAEDTAAFRELTLAYERAAFAAESVDRGTAESLLDAATDFGT